MHVVSDEADAGRRHHGIKDVVYHLAVRGTWNHRQRFRLRYLQGIDRTYIFLFVMDSDSLRIHHYVAMEI